MYYNDAIDSKRKTYQNYTGNSLDWYLGQPFSNSFSQCTTGLSCSGFVSWFYWRYFNENFALASSRQFNTLTGKIGNHLPLIEITEDQLKPFDIINFAFDRNFDGEIDDGDNGGHCAIYLSTYINPNTGEKEYKVLQSNMNLGIVFGTWAYDDEYFENLGQQNTTKFLRLNKEGISKNVLSQQYL